MSVSVRIPTILRTYTGGASEVESSPPSRRSPASSTPSRRRTPGSAPASSTTTGELRRFVNVYVDDEDVRFTDGLATPVADRARSRSSRPSPAADPAPRLPAASTTADRDLVERSTGRFAVVHGAVQRAVQR